MGTDLVCAIEDLTAFLALTTLYELSSPVHSHMLSPVYFVVGDILVMAVI